MAYFRNSVVLLMFMFISSIGFSQDDIAVVADVVGATEYYLSAADSTKGAMTSRQIKSLDRKIRKDSIRANKRLWLSVLGGPSYTPEASVGIAAALLATFRINKEDTISQRSFFPVGINTSINGTIIVSGAGILFFNENKFRIRTTYVYRTEPANYYGKGYKEIDANYQSDSTTLFSKQVIKIDPQFIWAVKKSLYIGTLLDISQSNSWDINPVMEQNDYFKKFDRSYLNVGVGAIVQYDTRDDVATPTKGLLLSSNYTLYSRYIGSSYDYHMLNLEYRQFQPLFERATIGWVAKAQMSYGDVPFTELPSFGSPKDLRGYYWGQYRDKSAGYSIVEYRQMFGSQAAYDRGALYSKLGYVVWCGAGTIGENVSDWNRWKLNYGVGLRIEIQPKKNFRLDIGKAHGQKGVLVYFNMTEAF